MFEAKFGIRISQFDKADQRINRFLDDCNISR